MNITIWMRECFYLFCFDGSRGTGSGCVVVVVDKAFMMVCLHVN
jgi:hypothetical protein